MSGKESDVNSSRVNAEALASLVRSREKNFATVQERVVDTLRIAIMRGIIPPGVRLRQEELASVFETSRIPIREALMALEYEGLVSSEPHRGFTVTELDANQVDEVYEIRIALESHALRLAIPLMTETDIQEIGRLYQKMEEATDPDAQLAARERFYHRLYVVTNRPRLVQMIFRLRQELARPLRWQLVQHSPTHHRLLYEAVCDGDVDLAVAELTSHYRKISSLIRRYLHDSVMTATDEFVGESLEMPTHLD